MQNLDFHELLIRLDEIHSWLAEAGINVPNRLRQYQKTIRSMLSQEENAAELAQRISKAREREIFWTYVEADEFVRAIVPLRRRIGDELSLAPVVRALDGPTDLYLETPKSNHGRNYMFELILGGRLAKAGFIPSFDRDPDLEFNFNGLRVAVECKRPFSPKGLEETIRKAISQLERHNADLSLMAVSVSRLWNSGDLNEIPVVRNPLAGQAELDARGTQVLQDSMRFWKDKLPRAAIFFYSFTPVMWPVRADSFGKAALRTEGMCAVMSDDEETKLLLRSLVVAMGAADQR